MMTQIKYGFIFLLTISFLARAENVNSVANTHDQWRDTLAGALKDRREATLGKYAIKNRIKLSLTIPSAQRPILVEWVPALQKTSHLTVLIVGIFGTPDSDIYRGMAKLINVPKSHMLVLPNSWSESVIKSGISFVPGDIFKEQQFTAELISAFAKEVDGIKNIDIVGVSYGGFIAPGVRLLLNKMMSKTELDKGKTVLIAPPLDFSYALTELDQVLDRAADEKNCGSFSWMRELLSAQIFATPSKQLGADLNRCLFTILKKFSFFPSLESAVQRLGEKKTFKGTFASYLEAYHGVCISVLEDHCYTPDRLEGWLNALTKSGEIFSLITSLNDPLNDPAEWVFLDHAYPQWDLSFYKSGGHGEFWHFSNFRSLINSKL